MSLQSIDPGVNPADETIRLGPLVVRFLVTGENSSGTVAIFEVVVPAAQRLTVHDLREALNAAGSRKRAVATTAHEAEAGVSIARRRPREEPPPKAARTLTCPHCGESFTP